MLGKMGLGFVFLVQVSALAYTPAGYYNNYSHYYPGSHFVQQQHQGIPTWHGAGPVGRARQVNPGGQRMDIDGNFYQRTNPNLGFVNGSPIYFTASGAVTEDGFVSNYDPTPWYTGYANSVRWVNGPTVGEERSAPLQNYWDKRRQQESVRNSRSSLPAQYQRHPVYDR